MQPKRDAAPAEGGEVLVYRRQYARWAHTWTLHVDRASGRVVATDSFVPSLSVEGEMATARKWVERLVEKGYRRISL